MNLTGSGSVANLAAEPTPFVGRADELAAVRELLTRTRLLTVAGPGGAGKTRLAKAAAAQAAAAFPEGAWFVELAPLRAGEGDPPDPAAPAVTAAVTGAVTAAVVTALGLQVSGLPAPARLAQELHTHIGGRRVLLVLDNCEHLVGGCAAFVDTLLRRCPQATVLATSRTVLNAPGETVWSIPPLDDRDAVALFCGRAQAALPSFVLDATNTPAVERICRSLDGMPLALELAAARVRVLSPAQIADRLADRFSLLRDGTHTTLRAVMDWSHDLLTGDERVVLRRLAVFPATFDIDAAEAVVMAPDTLGLLARLIDKSLVVSAGIHSAVRYRLLETVRQYADERLREAGEAQAARDRHTAYYAGVARSWLERPGDIWWTANDWAAGVRADEANHREAITHSIRAGDGAAAVDLVGTLWLYWLFSSRPEMRGWLAWAVEATAGRPSLARTMALSGLAFFMTYADDLDRARGLDLLATARQEARELADDQSLGCAHYATAEIALGGRDLAGARSAALVALDAYTCAKAPVTAGYCERLLGWVSIAEGDAAAARPHFERSLEAGRHSDIATAHAAAALAPLVAREGDAGRAAGLADEAVGRARRVGLRVLEAMTLAQAAKTRILAGDPAAAARHVDDLLGLLARAGVQGYVADALELAAVVLLTTGRERAAAPLAGVCDRVRSARGEPGLPDLADESAAARARGRTALGEQGWAAAVAHGALISVPAALAQAREALAGTSAADATAALRRAGEAWEIRFGGAQVRLRHAKGLADLAVLLARPGVDVHVLELASPGPAVARGEARGAPVLDDRALAAYRRRLAELDGCGEEDPERKALRAELRAAAGLGGRVRPLGADATERARKAVAGRLRDAVRRIGAELPELGRHLERSLVTGAFCRYQPREPVTWTVAR